MQIKRKGYNIRGFWKITDYAIRLAYMVTDEAQRRAKILSFWKRYGLKATMEAFGISRRTLFNWKSKLNANGGKLDGLNDKSKAPRNKRTRLWPIEIIRMIKTLRWEHPNLGKDKLHPLLLEYCQCHKLKCPSMATIGRLIADDPGKMRREASKPSCAGRRSKQKPKKKARKPKDFVAREPGECLALDSVEYHNHGQRRYMVTLIDVYSRFAFAYGTNSHTSLEASKVLEAMLKSLPIKAMNILTDNGSEFMKHFEVTVQTNNLIHWHTYPKTPKMNAHCERFNRSIQEEFADYHKHLLFDDIAEFNRKLADWLTWYNSKRVHRSLNKMTPIQYIVSQESRKECKDRWARTLLCQPRHYMFEIRSYL